MTTLREAAQQALEAMDWLQHHLTQHHGCLHMDPSSSGIPAWLKKTEAALKAALAEPDRPTMTPKELAASIKRGEKWQVAEPVQEPVAWMDREGDLYKMPEIEGWAPPHTMLYAAPPQRKPLTVMDLQEALVYTNLIDRDAIDDPEGYDEGSTLAQIDELHRVITGDNT